MILRKKIINDGIKNFDETPEIFKELMKLDYTLDPTYHNEPVLEEFN